MLDTALVLLEASSQFTKTFGDKACFEASEQ